MTKWIPSATWDPVPGGLCSNGEFLADMDRSDDQSLTWFRLPILGELDLNNLRLGRIAARDKREVSLPSRSSILIQCQLVAVVFVCRGKPQPIRPRNELPEQLHKITVWTDFYEQDGTLDSSKREQRRREAGEALAQYGVAVLTEFVSSVPSGGGLLDAAAYSLGGLAFTESVVQNVPRAGNVPDFGVESKLMCPPIHEDTHPVAMVLEAVAAEYLPGFVVATGQGQELSRDCLH